MDGAGVLRGMKSENNRRKLVHPVHLRLGTSEIKLNTRAVRIVAIVGLLLIAVLFGKEVDATTLKGWVRLVL